MNVSGSLDGLFIFSVICDDKTGLGRDVSPAYLFERAIGWVVARAWGETEAARAGWYQELVIQSLGLGSKCLGLKAADRFLAA